MSVEWQLISWPTLSVHICLILSTLVLYQGSSAMTYSTTLRIAASNGQAAPLFIQSKGMHAGRPLRAPIANCFAVWSDHPHLYAVAFAAWSAKAYRHSITGSVIPFMTIASCRTVLGAYLDRCTPDKAQRLAAIQAVDDLIHVTERKRCTMEKLRYTLAASI
jgi:hypothetical protein